MSQNLQPAFVGHPTVDKQSQAQRRVTAAHASVMLPPGLEYRVKFRDGTQSKWAPVSRGALTMPPVAVEMVLRRVASGVVR